MKMRVCFKDPDRLGEAVSEKRWEIEQQLIKDFGLSRVGAEAEAEERMSAFQPLIDKYFEWGEYLTVELDSDTNTIRVVSKDE